ncbi:MAG: CHASE2 domain-containing protein [Armatimonadota bacterium]|nr:CHASE2 domain-containing protein [Armatimonadota bacterium]
MNLERRSLLRRIVIFLFLSLLALIMYGLAVWSWNSSAELSAYDMILRMRFKAPPRPDVVVLAIDSKTIDELGPLPWDYKKHARIIRALTKVGASRIVYDFLFDRPDSLHPGADTALWEAVRSAENVFLPMAYDPLRETEWTPSDVRALIILERFAISRRIEYPVDSPMFSYYFFIPPVANLMTAAEGIGGMVGTPSSGVVREAQLAYLTTVKYPIPTQPLPQTTPLPKLTDQVVALPGLPLAVSAKILGVDKDQIIVDLTGSIDLIANQSLVAEIPIDEQGRMLINYVGPAGTIPRYSASDLLSGKLDRSLFAGKLVLVGVTDSSSLYAGVLLTPYGQMPRVEVTANALTTILDKSFLVRRKLEALAVLLILGILLGLLLPSFSESQLSYFAIVAPLVYILVAMIVLATLKHVLPIIPSILLILFGSVIAGLLYPAGSTE